MLGMKTNFQREGIGYTPPEKSTPQKSKTVPQSSKPIMGTYIHVAQKFTPINTSKYLVSHASRKTHQFRNHIDRSMSRVVCNYCGKHGHHIVNC